MTRHSLVILVPSDLVYANLIAKELIRAFPDKISLIIESGTMIHGHGFLESLKAYLKTCGFKYLSNEATKEYLYKFRQLLLTCSPTRNKEAHIFYSFRSLAKKYKIPIIKSKGISPAILKIIEEKHPDLIICVYFQHILGKKTLSVPRLGTLNIHPSLLPDYRGINPVFWALADGQKELGATVHFISKDIDCGDILAQKRIPIEPDDTEHSLFMKCSIAGAEILIKAIRDVQNNSHSCTRQQREGNYYSLPKAEAVCRFLERGRRFFRLREFFI